MGLFDKDILRQNESLIKNHNALDYEYLPRSFPYRENEQQYFASCIKPLFHNRSGRNLLIYGPPGIGKTSAVKHVLRQLEDETDDVHVVFVNCWQHNTTYKILLEMCDQLGYKFTQNKKTSELYKVVSQIMNKSSAVIVFDEIDKAEEFDFLYFVAQEIQFKSVFLITNLKSWLVELDERIKSRLVPELQEFRSYSVAETLGIMKIRRDEAFVSGVWEQDAFDIVAEKTAKLRDIRAGLFFLKESALIAEEKSRKKILKEDVLKAIEKVDNFTIKNSSLLEEETRLIYELVKEHSGKKIGDLYNLYKKKSGASSYKTFQRKIAKLEEGKFVHTIKQTGAGGNTTIVEKKITDF